jgi:hypothetical protein
MLGDKRQKKKKRKSSRDHMFITFSWIGEGTADLLHYKFKTDGTFEGIVIYRRTRIGRDERVHVERARTNGYHHINSDLEKTTSLYSRYIE